ncbi:hypothetical protein ACFFRE_05480 [Aciditerrimonas ferrireducens]|uniref:Uncharacterized protein n=1 Tax=Aciditerrimonas ferrireducens TaxID=667306 RepID=A0ABV6C2R6_9ACTN
MPAAERYGPSQAGSVLVEVGPGRGALVVWVPPALEGRELAIWPAGAAWDGSHVAVRRRELATRPRYAAFFGGLAPGRYHLAVVGHLEDGPVVEVLVDEGLAEVRWPDDDPV